MNFKCIERWLYSSHTQLSDCQCIHVQRADVRLANTHTHAAQSAIMRERSMQAKIALSVSLSLCYLPARLSSSPPSQSSHCLPLCRPSFSLYGCVAVRLCLCALSHNVPHCVCVRLQALLNCSAVRWQYRVVNRTERPSKDVYTAAQCSTH